VKRAAPLLLLVGGLAACTGEGDGPTHSPDRVQAAFEGRGFLLTQSRDGPPVVLQTTRHNFSVVVYASPDAARDGASRYSVACFLPSCPFEHARPMHKRTNVVVYYDPSFVDDPVEDRVARAMTDLARS
jgi:hypothetical protein